MEEATQADMCESCTSKVECDRRDADSTINWILEDQFIYCHEEMGKPAFRDDDEWLLIAQCMGGQG